MRMEFRLEGKTRDVKMDTMEVMRKKFFPWPLLLPPVRICEVFDSQRAQQGSEVFNADGERPQESQAVIWHRLVVPDSPGVVEKLFNDLNSEQTAKDDQGTR